MSHTTMTRRIIQRTESVYLVFLSHNSQTTKKTVSRFSCISLLFLDRRSNGAGYRKCSIHSKDPPTPTPRAAATKKLFPAERTERERRGTEVWAVTRFWYTASVKLVKVATDKITLFFFLSLSPENGIAVLFCHSAGSHPNGCDYARYSSQCACFRSDKDLKME